MKFRSLTTYLLTRIRNTWTSVSAKPFYQLMKLRLQTPIWPYAYLLLRRRYKITLELTYVAQQIKLCVPACASIVLKYYGVNIDQRIIKNECNAINYGNNRTNFYELIQVLRRRGFSWYEVSYRTDNDGYTHGLRDLIRNLILKRPSIITLDTTPNDHAVVIYGIDIVENIIYLLDPMIQPPGTIQMPFNVLYKKWKSDNAKLRFALFTNAASDTSSILMTIAPKIKAC